MRTALSTSSRTLLSALTLLVALMMAASAPRTQAAVPSPGSLDVETAVDLSARPLGEALRALAKQANLQILFEASLVAGRPATAIHGRMTPRAALSALLQGSGLEAYEQAPGVVVIRAAMRTRTPQTSP